MKYLKVIALFAFLSTMNFSFVSCASGGNSGDKMDKVDQTGPEYTSAYICPMHCEGSGSDQPGKCPVCGMDYVQNKDDHSGHDHGDHDGHNH